MKCSLVSQIFLKRSLVFPILLFSSISLHWSLKKAFLSLLAILWNSAFRCLYLSFAPLLFASLLLTAICKASPDSHFAFFCISFPWGWSWLLHAGNSTQSSCLLATMPRIGMKLIPSQCLIQRFFSVVLVVWPFYLSDCKLWGWETWNTDVHVFYWASQVARL